MEPTTALAGLDAHPWSTVEHAYGPAEEVPGAILSALTAFMAPYRDGRTATAAPPAGAAEA